MTSAGCSIWTGWRYYYYPTRQSTSHGRITPNTFQSIFSSSSLPGNSGDLLHLPFPVRSFRNKKLKIFSPLHTEKFTIPLIAPCFFTCLEHSILSWGLLDPTIGICVVRASQGGWVFFLFYYSAVLFLFPFRHFHCFLSFSVLMDRYTQTWEKKDVLFLFFRSFFLLFQRFFGFIFSFA